MPAGATRLLLANAAVTSGSDRFNVLRRMGSTTTWYSGVRPPTRSTLATPGILRKRGLMSYRAISHRSRTVRVFEVRLIPMMGKAENVRRYALKVAVAGRRLLIWESRERT